MAIYSWSRFKGSSPRDHRSSGRWCRHQRERETDDTKGHKGTRGHQHTIQQTNHCTPPLTALGRRLQTWHAVAMQCGVELLVSNSRTPPHCEGHSCLLSAPQRWGDDGNPPTLPHSGHGGRYVAPPWWLPPTPWCAYYYPVVATAYSPPHANTEGSAVARWEQGATMRVHSVSRGWSAVKTHDELRQSCV